MKKKSIVLQVSVIALCAVLFFAAFTFCVKFVIKGVMLYRDAIEESTIEERVKKIQSAEDFTPFSELDTFYINAVISVEDRRFERHFGVDPIAICRALLIDIKTKSFAEGGSTITQQVAKNMLFTQEKKLERKVAEMFAAFALEINYSKNEIFELYVNTAYFGSGYYGIRAAAEGYFGKSPSELSDYEAAMLAGLPNAPSSYSPDINPDLALQRAEQVLDSMVKNKVITEEEAEKIIKNKE